MFIGFWWSHVKREEQEQLLAQLRARLGKDVLLVLLDDAYVEGSSETVARTDAGRQYLPDPSTAPDGERYRDAEELSVGQRAAQAAGAARASEIRIERLELLLAADLPPEMNARAAHATKKTRVGMQARAFVDSLHASTA